MGIGSCRSGYGGSVTINGGTVMANAFNDAICTGRGGSITINDGDITARGGLGEIGRGNGIGPSWITYADITINGGNIDASADGRGAAIGGVLSTRVKITDGTIKAVGNYATVAIGSNEGRGGSVSITGGKITAIGKRRCGRHRRPCRCQYHRRRDRCFRRRIWRSYRRQCWRKHQHSGQCNQIHFQQERRLHWRQR